MSNGIALMVAWPDVRRAMEDEIELLIAMLDEIDGDADFEPDEGAEPSLGWCVLGALGTADDREEDFSYER